LFAAEPLTTIQAESVLTGAKSLPNDRNGSKAVIGEPAATWQKMLSYSPTDMYQMG
jgi:hypothetical protein